jgi:hypothetical protein
MSRFNDEGVVLPQIELKKKLEKKLEKIRNGVERWAGMRVCIEKWIDWWYANGERGWFENLGKGYRQIVDECAVRITVESGTMLNRVADRLGGLLSVNLIWDDNE